MCSINWTKSRGHILFYKILSKRSPWALKDEEPCLFYCKDTPNSLGGMRLLAKRERALRLQTMVSLLYQALLCFVMSYFWQFSSACFVERFCCVNFKQN